MFEAKIIIDTPELAASINNLAKALVSNANATTYLASVTKNEVAPKFAEANKNKAAVNPASTDTPVEVAQTPTAPAQEAAKATQPEIAPENAQPVKTYTIDDLSRAGAELIDQGKMPQLIDLLKRHGVQAITQLKPEQYGAVATELNALGANH